MERVEALKRILASSGQPRLELTSAVVSADRTIVEVRWFEPVRYFGDPGHACHEHDARRGCPVPAFNVRYDFDAHTGLPLSKRAPRHMRATFAAAVAKLNDLQATAANAA